MAPSIVDSLFWQKSIGLPELQTIQDCNLMAFAKDIGVQLRKAFLD